MKLTELNPQWVGHGGEGVFMTSSEGPVPIPRRERVAISMDCPCGCKRHLCLKFTNPVDGLGPVGGTTWERVGETFEDLTLSPSIQRADDDGCHWHGYITNGEIINC